MALPIQSDSQCEAFCFPQLLHLRQTISVSMLTPHNTHSIYWSIICHIPNSFFAHSVCVVARPALWPRPIIREKFLIHIIHSTIDRHYKRRVKGLCWADTLGPPLYVAVINSTLLNIYIYLLCNNWPTYLFCVFQFATDDLKQCHISQNRVYCLIHFR